MATWRLILGGTHRGQIIRNVFYYTESTPAANAVGLGDGFITTIIPEITIFTAQDVTYSSVEVENLDDVSDIYLANFTAQGQRVADSVAPFTAYGFKLNRTTKATRNGSKRFAGVALGDISAGVVTVQAVLDELNDLAVVLGNGVQDPVEVSVNYNLTIVRINPDNSRVENLVSSVDYLRVTTQNSRKYTS